MLKIVGIVPQISGACDGWRIIQPLNKIGSLKLAKTIVVNGHEQDINQIMETCDAVIFGRAAGDNILPMIEKLHGMDKKVIFDLDDNLFDISPFNQAYKNLGIIPYDYAFNSGERITMWKDESKGFNIRNNRNYIANLIDVLRAVDAITVTTEPLKDIYSNFNSSVYVVPNAIDFSIWEDRFRRNRNPEDDEVRILCSQAANHLPHMMFLIPVLEKIQQKYSNVKLVFVGNSWKHIKSNLDYSRVMYTDWIEFEGYPYFLKSVNADISIAPIDDSSFDDCRSAIKYYEAAMLGIPLVATNSGPYEREMTSETGVLVRNTEKEWIDGLSTLIEDKELRRILAKNALRDVIQNHNLDYTADEWVDVIKNVSEHRSHTLFV